MIDPLTSIAFSVQNVKALYALLLGSGLSSAAGVPTGWEVTLDLIRKVAAAQGEDCGTDPAEWYKRKTGQNADYSQLLDDLSKTPADRMNLLSSYFEPSADDIEHGSKLPTAAHKAIASLVRQGYIRVIVTTNFDRLLEKAVEAEGISPAIISSADAAKGALPLQHARCTIIKLHGDYRDTRIKNTAPELEKYEPELNVLLDKVFDEYGMIVCGWSAVWDKALCAAVLRTPNRRFTTYWARKGAASAEAHALIVHRQAVEVEIESADQFFSALESKVDAIERYSAPHPASAKLAVASLKKFIAEERHRIELYDLVFTETQRVSTTISLLSVHDPALTVEKILDRMKVYESASECLIAVLTHGGFWGQTQHQRLWADCIGRIALSPGVRKGGAAQVHLLSLQVYPACLLLYGCCLGAIAAENFGTVRTICRDWVISRDAKDQSLIELVLPWRVLEVDIARGLPGYERNWTPINNRIFEILREPLRDYLPDDAKYEDAFDVLEYLISLLYLDLRPDRLHAPVGRYGWRRAFAEPVEERLAKNSARFGGNWPIIKSGLFPSLERFKELDESFRKNILVRARKEWF